MHFLCNSSVIQPILSHSTTSTAGKVPCHLFACRWRRAPLHACPRRPLQHAPCPPHGAGVGLGAGDARGGAEQSRPMMDECDLEFRGGPEPADSRRPQAVVSWRSATRIGQGRRGSRPRGQDRCTWPVLMGRTMSALRGLIVYRPLG